MVGGLHTLLITKKSLSQIVADIVTAQYQLGSGKGAVAIRFRCADTSFCFVNCHLDSGDGLSQRQKRMDDLRQIFLNLFRDTRGSS